MSTSRRFPTAVHVLVALAWQRSELVSSDVLAQSVDTNPVVIRRLIGRLREAGLVRTETGAHGGATLARSPQQITLADVYEAVEEGPLFQAHAPNTECPIGGSIVQVLETTYGEAEATMLAVLRATTLAQVALTCKEEAAVA